MAFELSELKGCWVVYGVSFSFSRATKTQRVEKKLGIATQIIRGIRNDLCLNRKR